jgi:hypothetical protein
MTDRPKHCVILKAKPCAGTKLELTQNCIHAHFPSDKFVLIKFYQYLNSNRSRFTYPWQNITLRQIDI